MSPQDDLLSVVMGTGTSEAAQLMRRIQDDMVRHLDDALCSKFVHGEQPCDCPGEVCVGITLFSSSSGVHGRTE
jgi:hypothetical protein